MREKIALIGMEIKYLFRQKFLFALILLQMLFLVFVQPIKVKVDYYDAIEQYKKNPNCQTISEDERMIIRFWEERKSNAENARNKLAQKATMLKGELGEQETFEREYLSAIEKKYSKPVELEIQGYLGWELFFGANTNMIPHNYSFASVLIIAAAGILLFVKDKENKTTFWTTLTGKGMSFSSYMIKIAVVICYGILIHLIIYGVEIIGMTLKNYDMRHWFHMIQNIPQYNMCDLHLTIAGTVVLSMFLNIFIALVIVLSMILLSCCLKKYIFLFVGSIIMQGGLYGAMIYMCNGKKFDLWCRLNPYSSFYLDKYIVYDAINIGNHAVDVRVVVLCVYLLAVTMLVSASYAMWRKYLYER